MKLAGWPLVAITLGSASICSRFLACRALMVTPRLMSLRNSRTFNAFDRLNVPVSIHSRGAELAGADAGDLVECGAGEVHAEVEALAAVHIGETDFEQNLRLLRRNIHAQQVHGS